LVTGGAQGIGRRTAELLAERGYVVGVNDVQDPGATVQELERMGASAIGAIGDVSDEQAVGRIVSTVMDRFGRVDVLVNNAGISCIAPAEDLPAELWRRVMDVNLLGPFLLSQAVGRIMLERGSGSIVNVASIAGLLGIADRAAYNASKHGLIGLTRTLAAEWGGRGVRVNAVCPGWVKTPMDEKDIAGGVYTDSDIEGRVPMGRFASADDVAQAICFLAMPEHSGFVNGHSLSVDGGWYADGSWESLRMQQR
jgi:NAD(P)-dependent dehydrogenase (short-subunit alcohol dehydrogenase family)